MPTKCMIHGCNKKAINNYQKSWIKFPIDKHGDYKEPILTYCDIEEPTGEDNLFYCKKHSKQFEKYGLL